MEFSGQIQKKTSSLSKFEFNLFKMLVQLEQTFSSENSQILFNLQISGGKDSMCLLNAIANVFMSKICDLKNKYTLVVQHFNHKQRGHESDEDAFFVLQESLKRGLPVYVNCLPFSDDNLNNKQELFRNWRKKSAHELSSRLMKELNCDKYFIVTAHHARDHVETVLLHLLRGTGIEGLKGISILDESNVFFRPFYKTSYKDIDCYFKNKNILFREDSSNAIDKYSRNYIRSHILPHFEHLQPNYEESFLKMSRQISMTSNVLRNEFENREKNLNEKYILISTTSTEKELFYGLKSFFHWNDISENCVKNILHECIILLEKKEEILSKEIKIKKNRLIKIVKENNLIKLFNHPN